MDIQLKENCAENEGEEVWDHFEMCRQNVHQKSAQHKSKKPKVQKILHLWFGKKSSDV